MRARMRSIMAATPHTPGLPEIGMVRAEPTRKTIGRPPPRRRWTRSSEEWKVITCARVYRAGGGVERARQAVADDRPPQPILLVASVLVEVEAAVDHAAGGHVELRELRVQPAP